MATEWVLQFSKIQSRLEEGSKECLKLARNFTRQAEETIRNRAGFSSLPGEEILNHLQQLCPALYQVIGDVLLGLIPLLQPEDCAKQKQMNFYFWPGYHSYLANRRVFLKEKTWNFGVGVFRDLDAELHYYRDCSQARWYHYLIADRNSGPGDVHQWLRYQQQPRFSPGVTPSVEDSRKFVNSLTATTKAIDLEEQQLFEGNEVLPLKDYSQDTWEWGEQYAEFINQYRVDKSWIFPDRWNAVDQEARLRSLRCKMHSVWLHSVFCDRKPQWLDSFIQELLSNTETEPAGLALQQALHDKVADDWGDAAHKRPSFTCWSYLSLHASLAPSVSSMHESRHQPAEEQQRAIARQSLGSAEILSSIPLRPRYFSIVRSWISEVYGLVRNAEISILLENHKLEARKSDLAGPYWAHELMKLSDEGLSTAYRDLADIRPNALSNMKFVLHSIRMLSSLAYLFTGPIFIGTEGATKQREEFLKPLRQLYKERRLVETLRYVAEQTYRHLCSGNAPHVIFAGYTSAKREPENPHFEEYRSCFLIVSEMIRNYCDSERDTCSGTWNAIVSDDALTVTLTGTTHAQRNPASMTLARLNAFLRTLDIGSANVEWDKDEGMCEYRIEVNLATANLIPTEGSESGTSSHTNLQRKPPH